MGSIRVVREQGVEDRSFQAPKVESKALQTNPYLGVEVDVSCLLSISSFEMVLTFKLRCMLSLVSLCLKMTSNR